MGYIYCPREKESCEQNDRGESLANDCSANYLFRFNSLSTRLSSLWVVFRELDREYRVSYRESNSTLLEHLFDFAKSRRASCCCFLERNEIS